MIISQYVFRFYLKKYSSKTINVIGGVRTHECLCTSDLKSDPLDRSGTMTLTPYRLYFV